MYARSPTVPGRRQDAHWKSGRWSRLPPCGVDHAASCPQPVVNPKGKGGRIDFDRGACASADLARETPMRLEAILGETARYTQSGGRDAGFRQSAQRLRHRRRGDSVLGLRFLGVAMPRRGLGWQARPSSAMAAVADYRLRRRGCRPTGPTTAPDEAGSLTHTHMDHVAGRAAIVATWFDPRDAAR